MIPYEEALARVLAHARPLASESVPLEKTLGRRLARDVKAREPVPLFDQSAMDGYAVRAADLAGASEEKPVRLNIIGEIRAGDSIRNPQSAIRNSAIRIFTGAPVPRGADTVVMKEFCREEQGCVLIFQGAPGANIRRRGEEFPRGARVLAAGTRVTPPVIGLLATVGCARPEVRRQPRVALIVTGNELRAPGERLAPGQIRDANSYALDAALRACGVAPVMTARVRDELPAIRRRLAAALERADVVVTVGGVSVGDYDFVKEAAAGLEVETIYWGIAIKPGKPNYLGILKTGKGRSAREQLVFGLPGNPVAALVSFHLLVRPALEALEGAPVENPRHLHAKLACTLQKNHRRQEWVRGILGCAGDECTELTATPTAGQESHMLGGLAAADCLIDFPASRDALEQGELVRVRLLDW